MRTDDYTTVCDKCYRKTWYTTEQQCHYADSSGNRCTGTLRVIDNRELDPRFTRYYQTGERIEITYRDGTKTRCYVGKSTGWVPIYLEILRRDSTGGARLYTQNIQSIRGLGKYHGR